MVDKSVRIGKKVLIYDESLVSLNDCDIGDYTKIHPFVVVQPGVKIGKKCKIQSFVFIPEGVIIEDKVFIGPHVCFVNDKYPQATNRHGKLKGSRDWEVIPTIVKKGASIGANSTILCGLTIGEFSLVGAGAVVTRDVKSGEVVAGNPARAISKR